MRYRCPCGYESQEAPSAQDREIVCVYHIHRRSDIRDLADIVCMEPIQTPAGSPERVPEVAGAAAG